MRRVDSLLPEASQGDEFGQHAVKLAVLAAQIGYDAAIAEELASPTWDDPDWCRMIVARAGGQAPVFPEDDSVTFRCFKCKDTGSIYIGSVEKHGSGYQIGRQCDPCAWRMWARAQWLKRQEVEEGPRRGRKTRSEFD